MLFDMLILDSGEWLLAEELPAEPWHVLIYRGRADRRNELHLWLPRAGERRSGEYAFRRYWIDGTTRWCVEVPPDPDRLRGSYFAGTGAVRVRFTTADGAVVWAEHRGSQRLADFTDAELSKLRQQGEIGPFTRI